MKLRSVIKQVFEKSAYEYNYYRHLYDLPAKDYRYRLSAAEKKQVDELWGRLGRKTGYAWHELYADRSGAFDARYVTEGLYSFEILPRLNDTHLASAWDDKAYYSMLFPKQSFPKPYLYCIHGQFYSPSYEPLGTDASVGLLRDHERVFAKPSTDSRVGMGTAVLSADRIDASFLEQFAAASNGNCVFQEVIGQHSALAQFNESSVNILRMIFLRFDGECRLLHTTLRFGIPGSITDVAFVDGREILNGVGVSKDGSFSNWVYDAQGHSTQLDEGFFANGSRIVPNYGKAVAMCREVHEQLHHFDLVAFDVAIRENGEPVILEFNIRYPGISLYQFVHGPLFGEYTEDLVGKLILC